MGHCAQLAISAIVSVVLSHPPRPPLRDPECSQSMWHILLGSRLHYATADVSNLTETLVEMLLPGRLVPTCVIGEKVFLTALVGTEVLIPCQLTDSGRLTQLSWIKDHQEKPIVAYNPRLGFKVLNENYSGRIELRNQSLLDGSIRIKALELQDEGNYTCDFTIFPQGKLRKAVHLTILAVPTNIATSVPVKAGLSEVPVAQCIAAFGNPAADITWKSSLRGNHTTIQTANSDGTVNVSSLYKMKPRRSDNGQTVECLITHSATDSSNTYRLQLEIH
ncbi:hypothetical protein chiPu_0021461, partial [Chiloscyllium punctatum]|nr:hypothetical protein [Chiloscyllium punctatum]